MVRLLFLQTLLVLSACAAPVSAPEQPQAIVISLGNADGSCDTTLCCKTCSLIDVARVIDGDTFVGASNQSVRLFGVDTPERGEKCYQEATDRLHHGEETVHRHCHQQPRVAHRVRVVGVRKGVAVAHDRACG